MEHIFRRRPKDGKNLTYYQNMSNGEKWVHLGWEVFENGNAKTDTNLWELPDSEYHPIELYTGVNDSKRNEQYPEGQMIFKGDVLTSYLYPYRDNGKRNYNGIVCWDEESASFFILLKCVNPSKRGISDGLHHIFGERGEASEIYEVIDSVEVTNE